MIVTGFARVADAKRPQIGDELFFSHVRAAELAATGAQTIATACPFCNTMFRDALAATGSTPPQLLDIAQLTARSLPTRNTIAIE